MRNIESGSQQAGAANSQFTVALVASGFLFGVESVKWNHRCAGCERLFRWPCRARRWPRWASLIRPSFLCAPSAVGNMSAAILFEQCKSHVAGPFEADHKLSERQSASGNPNQFVGWEAQRPRTAVFAEAAGVRRERTWLLVCKTAENANLRGNQQNSRLDT